MLCFPNAKINLGLYITNKRPDGYHTIETIFYPVPLKDAIEATWAKKTRFNQTGLILDSAPEDNLVMKALGKISQNHAIPELEINLKKTIPSGAGLGGGSSDAAFTLKLINKFCNLGITKNELTQISKSIGADCPFFIENKPVIATGIGDEFTPINLSLKGYIIYIVKPPFAVSTKEAYSIIKPQSPNFSLKELPSISVAEWKNVLKNDFEQSVFEKYPAIKQIKDSLYASGAEYASMSGSGSAVFGLFKKTISPRFKNCFVWNGTLE